jgi:hypothetical protein
MLQNRGKSPLWPPAVHLGRASAVPRSRRERSRRLIGQIMTWQRGGAIGYSAARAIPLFGPTMTSEKGNRGRHGAASASESRQDRLKQALRENLKRRKSQARGRSEGASSETTEASLDDAGEKQNR